MEWHKQLTSYNEPDAKGKNPIKSIITVTRYLFKWHSPTDFGRMYHNYRDKLSNLRMKNGIAIETDGTLGDNLNQRTKSDVGTQTNSTGKLSRDFNFANAKTTTTCYLVDDNGNIISEIPNNVVNSIKAPYKETNAEKGVSSVLSGPALEEYMREKAEIDKEFKNKNLLYDKILCMCIGVEGTSYYFINDKLMTNIAKGSDVFVNQEEMVKLAQEQLGESFDAIQGFAN